MLTPTILARSRVLTVDLHGPGTPRVTGERTLDGEVLAARGYEDGTVRVVVGADRPRIRFDVPGPGLSPGRARALNQDAVLRAPVSAWLPSVRSSGEPAASPDCSQVHHPVRGAGPGTVTVLTLSGTDRLSTTAVAAPAGLVASSAHRLYLASSSVGNSVTTVHALAIDGGRTTYVASGSVRGTAADRWSLSEHDGLLRLVTTLGDPWRPREHALVVLDERGGRLVPTGRLNGLGRGEQLRAVRWIGPLAVLVTFRQTDPLHTVDLTDPRHPRLLGALRVPGWSAYLHPLGGGQLLGLGQATDRTGLDRGARAATFDLRDPRAVHRLAVLDLGRGRTLGVQEDPRTFTYLPALRTFLTTVLPGVTPLAETSWASSADTGRARLLAVHVGRDGSMTRQRAWVTTGPDVRVLPLGGRRVALVDDRVRVVSAP